MVENDTEEYTDAPELVFGLVGPIGVNLNIVQQKLHEALAAVGYNPKPIRLTSLMTQIAVDGSPIIDKPEAVSHYEPRIQYANAVRRKCDNDAALAALAIAEIRSIRSKHWQQDTERGDPAMRPIEHNAYIIRQLKRSEEIILLRKVRHYGASATRFDGAAMTYSKV